MLTTPDRITPLIARLERGDVVSSHDVATIHQLQTLDTAVLDQQFVEQSIARHEVADARIDPVGAEQ